MRRFSGDKPEKRGEDKPFRRRESDGTGKSGQRDKSEYRKKSSSSGEGEGARPYKKRDDSTGNRRDNQGSGQKPWGRRDNSERKPWSSRDKEATGRKPWSNRDNENSERKPWTKKDDGERKPFTRRDDSERKPWADKSGENRKPWTRREDGDRKPWGNKSGDEKKPWTRKEEGDRKPWAHKEEGDRKPRTGREGNDRKPWADNTDEGRKPWSRNEESERKPWARREDSGRKPWANKEDGDRKPWIKKEEGDRKPWADKSGDEKKPWAARKNDGERKPFKRTADKEKSDDGFIRLNKYIANAGICSRREADTMIQAGAVKVNGQIVTELGIKVGPDDKVQIGDEALNPQKKVYLLLNKPKGYITTVEDPQDRNTVMMLVKDACRERIYPVGRLDRNTSGLLLMTNDGEMAKKLTHPSHRVRKIYQVEVNRSFSKSDMIKLTEGIELEDGIMSVDEIAYTGKGEEKKVLGVVIHSGKNRVVRRLFEALDYEVVKLDRVAFANLTKKDLPRGRWRFLTESEINMLKMI